jgi:hypothetical protein
MGEILLRFFILRRLELVGQSGPKVRGRLRRHYPTGLRRRVAANDWTLRLFWQYGFISIKLIGVHDGRAQFDSYRVVEDRCSMTARCAGTSKSFLSPD